MQCDTILYYWQSAIEEFMMTLYLNSIYYSGSENCNLFFNQGSVCVLCVRARAAGAYMGIALSNG